MKSRTVFDRRKCNSKGCGKEALANLTICRLHYLRQSWINLKARDHEAGPEEVTKQIVFRSVDELLGEDE